MKKVVTGVVAGILTAAIVLSPIYLDVTDTADGSDNVIQPVETIVDENADREYAIINASKETFEAMDAHAFLETVTPTLAYYSGKTHTTFMFEDGTGIYFPFSDITKSAQYAVVDETGLPVQCIGDIVISGTNVTYTEVPNYRSAKTQELYQYVPIDYMNDSLGLCLSEPVLYASIGAKSETSAAALAFFDAMVDGGYDPTDIQSVFIVINDAYGYVINVADRTVTQNDEILDVIASKIGA